MWILFVKKEYVRHVFVTFLFSQPQPSQTRPDPSDFSWHPLCEGLAQRAVSVSLPVAYTYILEVLSDELPYTNSYWNAPLTFMRENNRIIQKLDKRFNLMLFFYMFLLCFVFSSMLFPVPGLPSLCFFRWMRIRLLCSSRPSGGDTR